MIEILRRRPHPVVPRPPKRPRTKPKPRRRRGWRDLPQEVLREFAQHGETEAIDISDLRQEENFRFWEKP
ncbi:hypothetical protein LZC95_19405 [Pendulispora brunnea]|uniref:Uncharacterized protein n=1 Tax=Pendulispora brunnea TaxID=2905690 RepID=A0ABZ2KLN9_9BACT